MKDGENDAEEEPFGEDYNAEPFADAQNNAELPADDQKDGEPFGEDYNAEPFGEDYNKESSEAVGGDDEEENIARDKAATKIQSVQRGKKARAELQAKAGVKVTSELREEEARDEDEEITREKAATKIQAVHRGKVARSEVKARAQAKSQATAGVEEQDAERVRGQAATRIQSVERGKQARAKAKAQAKAARQMEQADEQARREEAATKIQASQRGRKVRQVNNAKERALKKRGLNPEEEALKSKLIGLAFQLEITSWEEVFKLLDSDGSGKASFDEFLGLLRLICKIDEESLSDEEVQTIFNSIDVAGDGAIGYADDFAPWLTSPLAVRVTVATAMSGKISRFEHGSLGGTLTIKDMKARIQLRQKVKVAYQLLSMNGKIITDGQVLDEVMNLGTNSDKRVITMYLTDFSCFNKKQRSLCTISQRSQRGISLTQLNTFLKFVALRKETDSGILTGWSDQLLLPPAGSTKPLLDEAELASDAEKLAVDAANPVDAEKLADNAAKPVALASPIMYSKMNMYHAMRWALAPLSQAFKDCSYVELVSVEAPAQMPRWFVSHAWQNPVVSLVRCIETHARARSISAETGHYWVCAFAFSQKELELESASKVLGYNPVFGAMEHCMGMLLVLDTSGKTLSRIWCCFECSVAVEANWYMAQDKSRACACGFEFDLSQTAAFCGQCGIRRPEPPKPKQILFDVAVEDAELRFVLTDGLTPAQEKLENSEPNSGWRVKAQLESEFPAQTLVNALDRISLDAAEANREDDKDSIRSLMLNGGSSSLTSDQVNKRLRGFFATVCWRAMASMSDICLLAKLSPAFKDDDFRSSVNWSTRGISSFSNQHLQELGQALSPRLTDVQLECIGCADVNDGGIAQFTSGLPEQLKTLALNFTSNAGITDAGVRHIAARMPETLETLKLNFSQCDKITNDSICALAMEFPALSCLELRVPDCSCIGDHSMEAIAELLPESLEKLVLDFTSTGLTDEMLEASTSLENVRQLQTRIKSGERPRQRPDVDRVARPHTAETQAAKIESRGAAPLQTEPAANVTSDVSQAMDRSLAVEPKDADDSIDLASFMSMTKSKKQQQGPLGLAFAKSKQKTLFGKKLDEFKEDKEEETFLFEAAPPPKQQLGSSFKPTTPQQPAEPKRTKRQSRKMAFGMSIRQVDYVKSDKPPVAEEEEEEEEDGQEPDPVMELADEDYEYEEATPLRWVPPLTAAKDLPQEKRPRQYVPQEDEDPAISDFFAWAIGRWAMLHEVFKHYDHTGQYNSFRVVGAREFVEHVWWHGFEGNALKIFQGIQLESPGPNHGILGTGDSFGTISLAQLRRFEARYADLVKGVETPATRMAKALMRKRGSLLRAWRLDFDTRSSGLVAYADFIQACRRLGFSSEAKVLWNSFRPNTGYTTGSAPLEFREFDGHEAANMDKFAEALWTGVDFDINKAWTCIDPSNRGLVTLEEFTQGVRLLGFDGNARLLFKGLDSTGLGRLKKHELDYVQTLSVSVARTQYCAPPIRSLSKWAQVELGGPNGLLQKLGLLDSPHASLSIPDLTQQLQVLGYRGDAKRTATLAARIGGGSRVNGEMLYAVLADVGGHTSSPINLKRIMPERAPKVTPGRRPAVKEQWKGGVDDFAASNVHYPAGLRNYFSTPTGGPSVLLQKERRPKSQVELNTQPRLRRKRHERQAIFDQHTAKRGHRLDMFQPEDSDVELEDPYFDDPDFADFLAQAKLAQAQSPGYNDGGLVAKGDELADLFPEGYNPGKTLSTTQLAMSSPFQPPLRRTSSNLAKHEQPPLLPSPGGRFSRDKPAWDASLYDMSTQNSTKPTAQRQYFAEDPEFGDLLKQSEDGHHKDKKPRKEKKDRHPEKKKTRKSHKVHDDEFEELKRKYKRDAGDKSGSGSDYMGGNRSSRHLRQLGTEDIPEPEPGF